MIDNNNTYLRIEDYLNEILSKEEAIAFEKEMNSNPELNELVQNYRLANEFIIQAEIFSIKSKLEGIHNKSVGRKKLIKAVIWLFVAVVSALLIYFALKKDSSPKQGITKVEKSIQTDFITSDPTPLTIIDSMEEIALSKSIQSGKIEEAYTPILDTNQADIKPDRVEPKIDSIIKPKKIDSVKVAASPTLSEVKTDSVEPVIDCNLELNQNQFVITNSCSEKGTGSIQFTHANSELEYSIDNINYYKRNNFRYLYPGFYTLSIKNPKTACKSESLEIEIKGSQCNFAIEPDRLVYFELSLDKFQNFQTVEVFITNKNGVIVFSKTLLTSEKFVWKGNSNLNQPLPLGNYTYLIKGGKKISKGEITVIR